MTLFCRSCVAVAVLCAGCGLEPELESSLELALDARPVWRDTLVGDETIPWGKHAVARGLASGATVYVIDSGVIPHPDLNVIRRINIKRPDDPVAARQIPCFPHANHVAGIIGAFANGTGVQGIAPGTPIVSISILDPDVLTGGCMSVGVPDGVNDALRWVKADLVRTQQIGIINISMNNTSDYGWNGATTAVMREIALPGPLGDRGAFIAQSAGNNDTDACAVVFAPSIPDDGVMVIGAINDHGQAVTELAGLAGFRNHGLAGDGNGSNLGACVDAFAPGTQILSTWSSGYVRLSGTSMAAPHIAALAALLAPIASTGPGLEKQVRHVMYDLGSATPATQFNPTRVAVRMPSLEDPPDGKANPHSETYAVATFRADTDPELLPNGQPVQVPLNRVRARLGSTGMGGYGCDVWRKKDGGVAELLATGVQTYTQPTNLSWTLGRWEVWSNGCPSAHAWAQIVASATSAHVQLTPSGSQRAWASP